MQIAPSKSNARGLSSRATPRRVVEVAWLAGAGATLLWLATATAVAFGVAPPLVRENLWAWAIVPFASWGFYGVLVPSWVGSLAAGVGAVVFAVGLVRFARRATRDGIRPALAGAALRLRDSSELAMLALLLAAALAFGAMALAHTPGRVLAAMAVAAIAALGLASAFARIASRLATRRLPYGIARCAIVWLGAEALRLLLVALALVEPGPIAARSLLLLAWLATGAHRMGGIPAAAARVVVGTAALVPVLFVHRGEFDDLDFGPRAPIACAEVARQPGVLRVFGPAQGLAFVKFYDVLVIPERQLAVLSLAWDPRLALVDLERGTVETLLLTPPAPLHPPRDPALTGLAYDPRRERVYVTNACLPDERPDCPALWEIDLATRATRAFPIPGFHSATVATFVPPQDAIVVTPDWRENLAIVEAASGAARVLRQPRVFFWQSIFEPRSGRVLFSNTRFGRALWALTPTSTSLEPIADVGRVVSGMALDERRGLLYLGRPLLSRIDVRDSTSLALVRQLAAPFGVREIALDPQRQIVMAGSFHEADVLVRDLGSGAQRLLEAGGPARGVAIDPQAQRGYFTSPCGLVEIDLARIGSPAVDGP